MAAYYGYGVAEMKKHPTNGTGKGSTYRDVDQEKFSENWDRIFGKKEGKNAGKSKRGRKSSGK